MTEPSTRPRVDPELVKRMTEDFGFSPLSASVGPTPLRSQVRPPILARKRPDLSGLSEVCMCVWVRCGSWVPCFIMVGRPSPVSRVSLETFLFCTQALHSTR